MSDMSESPKTTAETVPEDVSEDAEFEGGSTSIDRSLMQRLKDADAKKAEQRAASTEDPDTGKDDVDGKGTAVVRYPSTKPEPEPSESTSPGVPIAALVAEDPEPATTLEPSAPDLSQIEQAFPDSSEPPPDPSEAKELNTDVRHDVVGLNEQPAEEPKRNTQKTRPEGSGGDLKATIGDLKATIDLPNRDDGWGSPSSGTGSHTKSAIRRALEPEPETGEFEQLKSKQGAALLEKEEPAPMSEPVAEDPDAPRLICIQGPDLGKEFVLNGRDIAIGRAPGNDVIVNDPSVSRVHCRLLIDEGQYVATDQRSGNGTIVNGRRIERANLQSGSTIKLGQTVLRFVEMGDVIKSTETESHKAEEEHLSRVVQSEKMAAEQALQESAAIEHKKRTGSVRYALIIVATATVLGLFIVVWSIATRSTNSGRPPEEVADEAYDSAALAVKAKELDRATEKLNLAISVRGNDPKLTDMLALVQKERGNLNAIEEAKDRAKEGRFADALVALASVAKDTMYKTDVTAAREEVRELVLAAVRRSIDAKDGAAMAALARDVADAYQDEPDIKRLLERVNKKDKPTENKPVENKPVEKPIENRPVENKPTEKPIENKPAKPGSTSKALDAFMAGRAEDAISELGQGGGDEATALKNKIAKFIEVYKDAKAKGDASTVKKALAFESKIAQGKSGYAGELRRMQGDALVDSGNKLMEQKKYLDAYKAFREASSLAPDAQAPKKRITEIQALARDLYNQGYIMKDSDRLEARAKWERVLSMVPADDELHQKAKKWLESTK